ncbi:MAG: 2-C-methyl-D-erythritol 4-phosphate cytidylyltransferase [Clostridia bacterium]|nr:2-C-methyl-D-erythritol 4-phosphate cytidylyltransferase [Clostridia bacterium]
MSKKKCIPTATAIIVAAGNSSRMGDGVNKQFLMINNIPVLAHTLMSFDKAQSIENIIIVTKPENIITVNDMVREFGISKIKAIVPGGDTRQASVVCGLKQIENNNIVAVHDGARPFVTPAKIDELVLCAQKYGAAVPGVAPKDTIKTIDENQHVLTTPDRNSLRMIQTPQVFWADELKLAYIRAHESGFEGTDDSSFAENIGIKIYIADGEYTNIKVTTPEDLPIAEAIALYLNK